jgi:hypothetical protein
VCVVQLNSRQIQLNLRLALHRFVRLVDSCIPIGGFLDYPSCGRLLQRHNQVIKLAAAPQQRAKELSAPDLGPPFGRRIGRHKPRRGWGCLLGPESCALKAAGRGRGGFTGGVCALALAALAIYGLFFSQTSQALVSLFLTCSQSWPFATSASPQWRCANMRSGLP